MEDKELVSSDIWCFFYGIIYDSEEVDLNTEPILGPCRLEVFRLEYSMIFLTIPSTYQILDSLEGPTHVKFSIPGTNTTKYQKDLQKICNQFKLKWLVPDFGIKMLPRSNCIFYYGIDLEAYELAPQVPHVKPSYIQCPFCDGTGKPTEFFLRDISIGSESDQPCTICKGAGYFYLEEQPPELRAPIKKEWEKKVAQSDEYLQVLQKAIQLMDRDVVFDSKLRILGYFIDEKELTSTLQPKWDGELKETCERYEFPWKQPQFHLEYFVW